MRTLAGLLRIVIVVFRSVAILIPGLSVFAQQEPPPLAVHVDVNLVNVAFVARTASGEIARDLTKDDFEVYEDGVPQEIRFFNRSADLPLRLAILLDMSGSQNKFVKQHHRDLEQFVRAAITPRDRAMLICFGNRIRVVGDFTASAESLMDALETYEHGSRGAFAELDPDETREGGTALFDAIHAAATEKLAPVRGERKAMLLFSDGEDNSSAHDLIDALEAAQTADALIYSVRYTETKHGNLTSRNRYGMREMDRFAAETGGRCFDAAKENVAESLSRVADELRSMYEVAYASNAVATDRAFHKVEIRPKRRGLTARARPGYFAR